MHEVSNPADLVGYEPDERLLAEDLDKLPEAVGRPETVLPSRARGRIVGTGAARLRAHAVRPPNATASVLTLISRYSTSGGSRRFELIWPESASAAARWARRRWSSSARPISAVRYASAATS